MLTKRENERYALEAIFNNAGINISKSMLTSIHFGLKRAYHEYKKGDIDILAIINILMHEPIEELKIKCRKRHANIGDKTIDKIIMLRNYYQKY